MKGVIPLDAPVGTVHTDKIAADILTLQFLIVNVFMVGAPKSEDWVLIDAGIKTSANKIIKTAEGRYGKNNAPKAIILTHGHFDHIGSIFDLVKHWDVPVYAHEQELPYLTGKEDYLPPDPSVGGGLMSIVSPLYPRKGIDLSKYIQALPSDGTLPNMPDWKWIHTPGHTKGHISLFRESDRILIAGDAFTTVKQESALAVLTQRLEMHGPPAYFTTDWKNAWNSVQKLEQLKPQGVFPSHGLPWYGDSFSKALEKLSTDFDQLAIPKKGKYVK